MSIVADNSLASMCSSGSSSKQLSVRAHSVTKGQDVSETACDDEHNIAWPRLSEVGLTARQFALRRGGIGGSDATIILSGDPDKMSRLWREKRGEVAAEDLRGVLPVVLGCWTEEFNRQWYQKQTGFPVVDGGSAWQDLVHPWRRATLDGIIESKRAIWEAKHTNAFAKPEEIIARYMPQLQHNLAVCNLDLAVLSVIYGNHKWECYEIAADWLYQDELLEVEHRFWESLRTGAPPVALPPPPAPKPVARRELCFDGNNAWADAAGSWLDNAEAAKRHAAAVRTLKALIEDDVALAFGHGVEARRSKAGAVTIREMGR